MGRGSKTETGSIVREKTYVPAKATFHMLPRPHRVWQIAIAEADGTEIAIIDVVGEIEAIRNMSKDKVLFVL